MPPRGTAEVSAPSAASGLRQRRGRQRRGSSASVDEVDHAQEQVQEAEHHLPPLKPAPQPQFRTYFGDNYADQPWIRRLNWLHVPLLTLTPVIALYGLLTTPWMWQTCVWSVAYYFFTGLGITGALPAVTSLQP